MYLVSILSFPSLLCLPWLCYLWPTLLKSFFICLQSCSPPINSSHFCQSALYFLFVCLFLILLQKKNHTSNVCSPFGGRGRRRGGIYTRKKRKKITSNFHHPEITFYLPNFFLCTSLRCLNIFFIYRIRILYILFQNLLFSLVIITNIFLCNKHTSIVSFWMLYGILL